MNTLYFNELNFRPFLPNSSEKEMFFQNILGGAQLPPSPTGL